MIRKIFTGARTGVDAFGSEVSSGGTGEESEEQVQVKAHTVEEEQTQM